MKETCLNGHPVIEKPGNGEPWRCSQPGCMYCAGIGAQAKHAMKNNDASGFSLLKTSEQWYQELGKDYMIINPDGWDRKNYDYSWNQELITEHEYNKRVMNSTIRFSSSFGTWVAQ